MKRLVLLPALFAASPALAHLDPLEHGSFAAGFSHPMFGADHILAMVAVGLWAVTLGGRALWALPAAFVGAMSLGFGLALAGAPLPMVEPMILASVLVLGVLVALAVRLPLAAGAAVVGALALFHGHAHGAEMGGAAALAYLGGFALATALLHGAGVLGGWALARFGGPLVARGAGVLVAGLGSALVLAG
ncbi:HupE/UreJ family protein [Rhodovulum euryhalinum]|uniref:Urease accessory protein n=1 Tax=Rhodovulum euryhalinum TaxID=35805 RepID=A0A4R2KHT6_9RHOB|nr:HupE/UreJ family protein [Rhodovulum euryhalinum]TCO72012.1 urease accessory protein [Rhodovulum euryhalinum]